MKKFGTKREGDVIEKFYDAMNRHPKGIWISQLARDMGVRRQCVWYYLTKKDSVLAKEIRVVRKFAGDKRTFLKIIKLKS